jgi:hypothetical protein
MKRHYHPVRAARNGDNDTEIQSFAPEHSLAFGNRDGQREYAGGCRIGLAVLQYDGLR